MERGARVAYLLVAWLFVVCVVVQFFLAGLGVFESGARFETHRDFGYLFGYLALFLPILALIGRLPRRQFVGGSLLLLVLFFMQSVFVAFRTSAPVFAALHPLNGALILFLGVFLALRARKFVPAPLGSRRAHPEACSRPGAGIALGERLGFSQALDGHTSERLDQAGVRVERCNPREAHVLGLGLLAGADVDVVEDLQMIGKELDGRDQDRAMAG
jgi:hypothetical protein